MLPPRGTLVVESADVGHVIAVFNPLLIALFSDAPTPAQIKLIEHRANEAADEGVRGGVLYVVARKRFTGGLEPHVRAAFTRMIRRNEDRSGASAVVVLTEGIAAAFARLAATSVLALFDRRGKLRVFGELDPAIAWLAEEHGLPPDGLQHAYERATSYLDIGRAS